MNYYNLAVHSCYDLLNSTIKLEELFKKLKEDEQEAVCISDPCLLYTSDAADE